MPISIPLDHDAIAAFALRWGLVELALFGSVLRDDFRPDSDVDVLATFARGRRPSLDDLLGMQDELEALFGRKVDLMERGGLERDRNYLLRQHILTHSEPVYVASNVA
jgi:uncharacterized protein